MLLVVPAATITLAWLATALAFPYTQGPDPYAGIDDPVRALALLTEADRQWSHATADLPPAVRWELGADATYDDVVDDWGDLVAKHGSPEAEAARDEQLTRWKDPTLATSPGFLRGVWTFAGLQVGFRIAGLLVVVGWLVRGRPDVSVHEGAPLASLGFLRGLYVFLWSFAAMIASVIGGAVAGLVPMEAWALPSTLALPSILLLRPLGADPWTAWGFDVRRIGTLAAATVAAIGVDHVLQDVVQGLFELGGYTSSWAEGFDATIAWGRPWEAAADVFDACVGAPIVEEVLCRGILYPALRSRLPVLPAALVSGLLFGALHGYAIDGLVSVALSGVVWALVYERTRSLVPGIVAHAVGNAFAVGWFLLLRELA